VGGAPATAPKLVQVLVSQLRKQLADSDAEILTRGRGYELRIDPDAVDALHFERLATGGGNGSHAQAALAMWRGPPLDDLADEPFAAPEIRRLEDLWLGARESAIDAALADGRHAEVLGELDELVRAHPLRERLRGQRMLALYRSGRQAEALDAFRDARRDLLDQVGLEPGPDLRHLNDAILRQDPELDGPPPRSFPAAVHRRRRWLLVVAAVAVAVVVVVVLAVTQLGGSDGLDGVAEDSLGEIDPANGHIVAQAPVGHAPDAAVAGGGSVWTANGSDGTVSRVDRGGRQVTTIDVGGEPTALAFSNGSLWVADGENRRVEQVAARTNRVVRIWPAGNAPRGVAIAGGALWITSAVDGQVERFDLAPGSRLHRIDVPGAPAAIAAGAGAVWVAGEEEGEVTKLDPRSGRPLRTIGVGNGPSAVAVGYGGVWVANHDDGTVTRVDTTTEVGETVRVGGSPVAVTAGLGAIWVADGGTDQVIQIDPRTRRPGRHIALGSTPSALAVAGGSLWTGAIAARASHRGGTLRYASVPSDCNCVDPAGYDQSPLVSLAYDGLVSYRRIPGAGGSTLVADLAASLPPPSDGARAYTFELRPGLRFSDGTPVQPEDFRASIERIVRISPGGPIYSGIVGADACTPRGCDLARGIETDAAARTITIHLRRPDPEFLQKLASPLASVLPARTPVRAIRSHPAPGTGPYEITSYAAGRSAHLVRNPSFRSWSDDARPDGFPDGIDVSMSKDPMAPLAAVQHGRADAVIAGGANSPLLPAAQTRALTLADPTNVYTAPAPITSYLFANVNEPPFDDARVRQAVNYAVDRRRLVALGGGSGLASLTCQLIPPGLPGYVPTCAYTRDPTSAGGWSAPDLARARGLVAASGSRGARVHLWGLPRYPAVARYVGGVLRQLGYRVRVTVFADPDAYFTYVNNSRHHAQIGLWVWATDFLTPSSFFEPFTCRQFVRGTPLNENASQFCDHGFDAAYGAALAARGNDANARWAALDRRALAASPVIPLFNRRTLLLVSDRVGNAQVHEQLGPLLDQFWVR
jgi:peptide/nickel transport system substrate-binding protein